MQSPVQGQRPMENGKGKKSKEQGKRKIDNKDFQLSNCKEMVASEES